MVSWKESVNLRSWMMDEAELCREEEAEEDEEEDEGGEGILLGE